MVLGFYMVKLNRVYSGLASGVVLPDNTYSRMTFTDYIWRGSEEA